MSENKKGEKFQIDPSLQERIPSLYAYMAKKLKINQSPKIYLVDNPANAKKPFGLTGVYDNKSKSMKIYINNRHPIDIMRSIAHEVIHHWQNEKGEFEEIDGKIPQRAEELRQPHYAQNDPHLRKMEKQAYLLGNILFRDWEDEQRYGPTKITDTDSDNDNGESTKDNTDIG